MPGDRDHEWAALGLTPEEQELLRRHRPTSALDPDRARVLSEHLVAELLPTRSRDRLAGLRLVIHDLRTRPLDVVGSTIALLLLGVAATVLTVDHLVHVRFLPALALAVIAPWMAFLLVARGPTGGRDALALMEHAAPLGPSERYLWKLLFGSLVELLLVLSIAVWSGQLLNIVWSMLLLQWLIPFTLSAGVALVVSGLLRPSRASLLLWMLSGLNTFAWIADLARVGAAPLFVLNGDGVLLGMLLAIAALGLGILVQMRRPALP